ncbi:MAG: sugar transferase [Chloroflexota bacterium]
MKGTGTLKVYRWLIADLALSGLALFLAGLARETFPFGANLSNAREYLHPILYLPVIFVWALSLHNLAADGRDSISGFPYSFTKVIAATTLALIVLSASLYFSYRDLPRLLLAYFLLIDLLLMFTVRAVVYVYCRSRGIATKPRRCVVVGLGAAGHGLAEGISSGGDKDRVLVGLVSVDPDEEYAALAGVTSMTWPILGSAGRIADIIHSRGVDEVMIALPYQDRRRLANLIAELQTLPVQVGIVPDAVDLAAKGQIRNVGGVALTILGASGISEFDRVVKRFLDIVVSVTAASLLLPIMAAIALAIRLDSPGPCIFRQMRVGEAGHLFCMYKFRTMVYDAEARLEGIAKVTPDGVLVHKIPLDPRVTRVGRFLRKTSLDELPQLANIILGQMSLVGPRPEMPYIVQQYEPWQWARFSVPQGLTGWWQISGRSDRLMHLHTEDDLYYISNYSLWLDLRILWKTLAAVLRMSGAF